MQRNIAKIKFPVDQKAEYFTKFDIEHMLSYDCDYSVVTSIRNLGKSYACMQHCIDLIKDGKTVLWERYNKDEMALACKTWENFAPDLTYVKSEGIKTYTDEISGGELMIISTSVANNIKGYDADYEHLPVLEVKDEFLPVRYNRNDRFINEFREAMEIRKTFKRNGPMRSIYLSNCLNWINPYTINWKIPPVTGGECIKITDTFVYGDLKEQRKILWYSVKPTDAQMKRVMKTEVSSMNIASFDEYFNNAFYKEYDVFGKCPDMSKSLSKQELMTEGYYMNYRSYNGRFYIQRVQHERNKIVFVSEPQYVDFEIRHFRDKQLSTMFESYFNAGVLVFDTSETYYAFLRWIINSRKQL